MLNIDNWDVLTENENNDTGYQQVDMSKCLQKPNPDNDIDSSMYTSSSESCSSVCDDSMDISETSLINENDRRSCETAPLSPFNNEIDTLYTDQFGDGAIILEAKSHCTDKDDTANDLNEIETDLVQADASNAGILFQEDHELLSRPLTSPEFRCNESFRGRQLDVKNEHQFSALSSNDEFSNKDNKVGFIPISEISAYNDKLKISYIRNNSMPHNQIKNFECKERMQFPE